MIAQLETQSQKLRLSAHTSCEKRSRSVKYTEGDLQYIHVLKKRVFFKFFFCDKAVFLV